VEPSLHQDSQQGVPAKTVQGGVGDALIQVAQERGRGNVSDVASMEQSGDE